MTTNENTQNPNVPTSTENTVVPEKNNKKTIKGEKKMNTTKTAKNGKTAKNSNNKAKKELKEKRVYNKEYIAKYRAIQKERMEQAKAKAKELLTVDLNTQIENLKISGITDEKIIKVLTDAMLNEDAIAEKAKEIFRDMFPKQKRSAKTSPSDKCYNRLMKGLSKLEKKYSIEIVMQTLHKAVEHLTETIEHFKQVKEEVPVVLEKTEAAS